MNEGICTAEEAYEEVISLQLDNITNDGDKEVILITGENLTEGYGYNIKPIKVMIAVIEMTDDQRIKGIIIDNTVAVSITAADAFCVAEEPNGDMVIICGAILDKNDHPYSEIELDKFSRN